MGEIKKIKRVPTEKEIDDFLLEFCFKDRKKITSKAHESLMKHHFYYVDRGNCGQYVKLDWGKFKRDLTIPEFQIYMGLWDRAVKRPNIVKR